SISRASGSWRSPGSASSSTRRRRRRASGRSRRNAIRSSRGTGRGHPSDMPAIDHVDLVVTDIERSLAFYRKLLEPLRWGGPFEQRGEQGETIHYLFATRGLAAVSALGLR